MADSAGSEFITRTIYNQTTELYEEERVPLRQAYEDVLARLQEFESEDVEVQRRSWREGVARADHFQETVTGLFESTLKSARNTYRLLTAMSIALFVIGVALFVFAALYGALAEEKVYSLVFGGLGAGSFVALFVVRPYEDAQDALSNMIQGEIGFMAFFEQIRMWANYPWVMGSLDPARVEKASLTLHRRTAEAMRDLQRYIEKDHADGAGARAFDAA